jgi:hypothetical protein
MATVCWDVEGVTLGGIMPHGQTINWDLYIQTLKTLQKHFGRVRPHKYVAEILLQHENAQRHTSLKTQEAITKLGQIVLPHPPYCPDLAPSEMPPVDKGLGVIMWLLKKWLRVQNLNWYKNRIGARFSLAQGCWSWWRLCRKMKCVRHPSSYPISKIKALYNKLLAIKNCVAKIFRQAA